MHTIRCDDFLLFDLFVEFTSLLIQPNVLAIFKM